MRHENGHFMDLKFISDGIQLVDCCVAIKEEKSTSNPMQVFWVYRISPIKLELGDLNKFRDEISKRREVFN